MATAVDEFGFLVRLNRILPWVIGLAVLGLILTRYLPQIHKNEDLRRQLQQRTEQAQKLEAEVKRLHAENNAMRNDPRTIERTAREQLSFARADERVVTFQEAATVRPNGAGRRPAERPLTPIRP